MIFPDSFQEMHRTGASNREVGIYLPPLERRKHFPYLSKNLRKTVMHYQYKSAYLMYLTNFWSNLLYVAVHVRYYNSKYFWLYMVDWYGGSSCFSIPRSFMEVIVNQCSKIFTSCPKHGLNKCLIALIFHVYGQVILNGSLNIGI